MNQSDMYYRAMLAYRALTEENPDCVRRRDAFSHAFSETDRITVTRRICTVDEDWVCEIEKGLSHVEKALRQERQFIYSQGEVKPIEKVRHVSKESVEHLARHSELVSREPEGEDIVPDALYSVERLNDYTVYENRFLYMLLCCLRDFVALRYNRIREAAGLYEGTLSVNDEVAVAGQKITYRVELSEARREDACLREASGVAQTIDRIDLILKTILAFLSTPLMESQKKAARLKPPITKTNVMKMDNSFKGAVALYEYIIAYDKPGYRIETQVREIAPFEGELAGDMSEVAALLSFLTYEYGLGLRPALKEAYEDEKRTQLEEEQARGEEQLTAMRRRMSMGDGSPEAYIQALEKQVRILQTRCAGTGAMRREIEYLRRVRQQLIAKTDDMYGETETLRERADTAEDTYARITEQVRNSYERQMEETQTRHTQAMGDLSDRYSAELDDVRRQLERSDEAHRQTLKELTEQKEKAQALCLTREAELAESRADMARLQAEYDRLLEEKRLAVARLRARKVMGDVLPAADTPDGVNADGAEADNIQTDRKAFVEQPSFDELEQEYRALTRLYRQAWRKTKKHIRKQYLNAQTIKGSQEPDQ